MTSGISRSASITDDYFEVVYGPLIGPTSVLLARALVRHTADAGGETSIDPAQLAREVGIRAGSSEPLGKGSQLAKSLRRLSHHRIVIDLGDGVLGIATRVPLLSEDSLPKLPEAAQRFHRAFEADRRGEGTEP